LRQSISISSVPLASIFTGLRTLCAQILYAGGLGRGWRLGHVVHVVRIDEIVAVEEVELLLVIPGRG